MIAGGGKENMAELGKEFMGSGRAKMWTYLIGMITLLVLAVVANFAIKNPETMKHGVQSFMGLPRWAFPLIVGGAGALIYWIGLKIETDWPEAIGAFLIAGAVVAGELLFGWKKFALGGLAVMPYIIPFAVFVVLLIVGMMKSK
jgi:uncharacterized membrane protein